ncbi:MAG TPA: bifunctional sulfate adenylyltransferase/adenylylsulfate kinase [Candidatus Polarisedimenticolaceae bacterium]|nr:bifunctional sulfate adenylyltransferase/adenylylsulfate kinase [Candidatus Polarisedimenticolaceae bacterium]
MATERGLIAAYGGRLVELTVSGEEQTELLEHAKRLPSVRVSEWALHDLELLAVGAFSPLTRFLGPEDYRRVLEEMRLADGTLWPIPITLPVDPAAAVAPGKRVALRDPRNEIVAVLDVEECFPWDPRHEVRSLVGRWDPAHPLVGTLATWGAVCVSGPLRVLQLPVRGGFADLRLPPRQVRARLAALEAADVVAFQTRNPLHRSHEELLRRAVEQVEGVLLLHPVVGLTKPGDVDHVTRVRGYRTLVDRYYDPRRTLLSLLPLAMRMAGPREALWHAIIRRNYGANHFIVGRDHAGPGIDSQGRPFFAPYAAQELVAAHAAEIGVAPLCFEEFVYLPDEDRYEETGRVPAGTRTAALSGTQVREEYLAVGRPLPAWFTRPEVAAILAETHPPRHKRGFCVWFTGLSGAGKSTTAELLTALLLERGRQVTLLDGDVVRQHLSSGLGFSPEERDANIRRIGFVAAEIVRHHGVAVCAAISPYAVARSACRELVGADRFIEVFMDTPLAVCEARDAKGLYAKARRGEIQSFTGVSDPYEPPPLPELRLTTTDTTPAQNVRRILEYLGERHFVQE